jgi:predicted metal-dependent phosphotriesterase family hydrolase
MNMKGKISRKEFIANSLLLGAGSLLLPAFLAPDRPVVMTVNGPLETSRMGFTLYHEHVMADFIGAGKYSKSRYNADEVFAVALPFMKDAKANGTDTFIDCTPAYLGRDVTILKRLSDAAGMNVLTTTGYYGAVNEKFVPAHAYNESAQQLADRWIKESRDGIEGTGIKPGLIKTSTDKGPLTPMQRKLILAAGITHLATGLTIAVHSGDGQAASEQLEILKGVNVSPSARVWVHAQNESDKQMHIEAAKLNTWVAFDGVNPDTLQVNLDLLRTMKENSLLDRVLVSHDSGWYNVGEPNGGNFKPYTCIATQFIPLLKQNGFTTAELDLLFKTNPAKAFAINVRKL